MNTRGLPFMLLLGTIPAMAANGSAQTPSTAPAQTQQTGQTQTTQVQQAPAVAYCPLPSALTLKKGAWSSPGWSSANSSFITTLTRFIAAQWSGTNIGRVTCVYGGDKAYTFPVALENADFLSMPMGGSWGGVKNGSKNCIATDVTSCPFSAEAVTTSTTNGQGTSVPHISEQSTKEQNEYLWLGGKSPSSGQSSGQ